MMLTDYIGDLKGHVPKAGRFLRNVANYACLQNDLRGAYQESALVIALETEGVCVESFADCVIVYLQSESKIRC